MSESQDKVILAVDDEPTNIQLLSGVLSGKYKVKAATSGAKAIQVSQKAPPPDLILLDVMMPEMDGYEVCKQLKANPETSGIPIVFVTGNNSAEEEQRGLAMGAVGYLGKPVDAGRLLALIEQTIG